MRITLGVSLFCLLPIFLTAQLSDNFSDGNFTEDPQWIGDTDLFIVEDEVLRLADNKAGQAYLVTQNSLINNIQWEFWVRMDFTPTSNNHPEIYLVSDSPELNGPLQGYFVRIGKDGSDNKRIFFLRRDGFETTELLAGSQNIATATHNIIRIRVLRDASGNWEIEADPYGGNLFIPQGNVFDNTYCSTSWFGIKCNYTVSNANRFYFDDFYAGEISIDNEPFVVKSLRAVSANQLDVHFSRVVEPVSSQTITNYFVNNGINAPVVASRNPLSPNIVSLIFADNFSEKEVYELHLMGIKDYRNNIVETFIGEFVYYIPRRFDVVFNELMVDPLPQISLPAFEYIELLNISEYTINLEGWVVNVGNSFHVLPFAEILPGQFILLTSMAGVQALMDFGKVVGVPGLSPTALINSGATLSLFDNDQNLISFVSYTDKWYQNPAKADGGWSLEKIDPFNYCQGITNWKASVASQGGTPGQPNSVAGSNPDFSRPYLVRTGFIDEKRITLHFSEPMDEASVSEKTNFLVMPVSGYHRSWNPVPVFAIPLLPEFSKVELELAQPMNNGVVYEVIANASLADCSSNFLDRDRALAAVPVAAGKNDIVINEVLFNPAEGGVRYVEFYNRSHDKVIDLKHHIICSMDTISGYLHSIRELNHESFLFFPQTYLVATPDPGIVRTQYMTCNPDGFIETDGFPPMTNTSGIIVLGGRDHVVYDIFVYNEDMHFPLLTSKKGIALERLNPDLPTQDRSNWHSASQSCGFGTPAYQNSQYAHIREPDLDPFIVYPDVFCPDGDGYNDLLNIGYALAKPGLVANIRIFDSRGRIIRTLRNGELLATQGVITWDGTTDKQNRAATGIYIIHIEVFDLNGNVKNFKKTAVLGEKLN